MSTITANVHVREGDSVEYCQPVGQMRGGALHIGDLSVFPPHTDAEALEFFRHLEAAAQDGAMTMKKRLLAASDAAAGV